MKLNDIVFLNKDYKFVRGSITIENNIITDIKELELSSERGLIPPFTDIHIHGGYGVDVMDNDYKAIGYLSKCLLKDNVGMWLPTTVAQDFSSILNTAKAVKKAAMDNNEIAGIHIEGPFISDKYKGIMEEKYIKPCSTKLFDDLKDILGDLVIRFTIAPECEGAEEFCSYVTSMGGFVSMGHSGADKNMCKKLINCGANCYTHIFNAMASLHHRNENILSCALSGAEYCEIIADEIHISPDVLKLALNVLGKRAVLITDALRPMGMGEGSFEFCGSAITVDKGRAANSDGKLAGSVLSMKNAVLNTAKYIGCENAVRLACENPARVIGKFDEIGSIQIGKRFYYNI